MYNEENMKVLREYLREYIRYFGYTGQGDDGTPFTNFFEYKDILAEEREHDGTLGKINGYKDVNAATMASVGKGDGNKEVKTFLVGADRTKPDKE